MRRGLELSILWLLATQAGAATLTLSHPFGELIDEGQVEAQIAPSRGSTQDCAAPVRAEFPRPFEVRLVSGKVASQPFTFPCAEAAQIKLGPLAAGSWTFVVEYHDRGETVPSERLVSAQRVYRKGLACNRYPDLNAVWVMHQTMNGPEVAASLDDPAFAALVQNPVGSQVFDLRKGGLYLEYTPLVNLNLVAERIRATGQFRTATVDTWACFSLAQGTVRGRMIEFHHGGLDQYFYTAIEQEIAALDSGALTGWARTGQSFAVLLGGGCLHETDYQPAYRFWGKPGRGPSSHVFTTDREECAIVDQTGDWIYETSPFWALPPGIDGCPAYLVPLYRAWRSTGETRHRFSTDRSLLQAMAKDGWIDEGVRMCVEAP